MATTVAGEAAASSNGERSCPMRHSSTVIVAEEESTNVVASPGNGPEPTKPAVIVEAFLGEDIGATGEIFAETFREAMRVIALQSRMLIGAHQCAVSYIPRGDFAKAIHAVSLSPKYEEYNNYDVMPRGCGIWNQVVGNRAFRLTHEELISHPCWRNFSNMKTASGLEHPPMRGWLAVPIMSRADGTNIGLLQLSDKFEGEFSEYDQSLVELFATLLALTFELHVATHNLTAAERRVKNEQVAKAKLDARIEAHEQFISHFSHEIRNPLHGMRATMNSVLRSYDISNRRLVRDLRIVDVCCHSLVSLVNDALDRSALLSSGIRLHCSECSPFALVRDTANLYRYMASVPVQTSSGLGTPSKVFADAGRVRQVLTNGLMNAIKHTRTGEIRLRVSHEQVAGEAMQTVLVFSVQDTGPGLGGVDPESLFASSSSLERAQGTVAHAEDKIRDGVENARSYGLGLGICRNIARAMGGTITLEDTGCGTRFTFELPCQVVDISTSISDESPSGDDADGNDSSLAGTTTASARSAKSSSRATTVELAVIDPATITVVVADDEDINLMVAERMFSTMGFGKVSYVNDGPSVLQELGVDPADDLRQFPNQHCFILLLDIVMNRMDGDTVCKTLRTQGWYGPIVACTANASREDIARYLSIGFTAVLTKPFLLGDLQEILMRHFHVAISSSARPPSPASSEDDYDTDVPSEQEETTAATATPIIHVGVP